MMDGDDEGDDMDDMGDDEGEEEPEEEAFAFESDDEEVDESDEDLDEGSHKREVTADMEKMSKAEFAKKYGKEMADDMYEAEKTAGEQMREYVEKVNGGGLDAAKIGGDNGANAKSPTAGKNDMGGTASNLNQGKDNEAGDHAGLGDLNPKDDDAGNRNKPGGMSSKKGMKNEPGHGAEKKGKAAEKPAANSPIGS